ncbi:MAG: GC-type dockerin domain-anchored protein [Planctomycetota bacterium]
MVIADAGIVEDDWVYSELIATAPSEAVEARVSLVFVQPAFSPGGSVFVDSVTLTAEAAPCVADIAQPFGVLDLGDVDRFILGFLIGNSAADLAEPFGVLDLGDVDAFIGAFLAGCP